MNDSQQYLTAIASFHGGNAQSKFLLAHGRAFEIDERTFKAKRMTIKECFSNATKMVWHDPSLTYVEGYVTSIIPIHHAWVMRPDGGIIDPTMRIKGRAGDMPHDYFGVPFSTRFLNEYLQIVRTYGLLDGMSNMSIALMTGKIEPTEFLSANALENAT
jgi:hypothetical protein